MDETESKPRRDGPLGEPPAFWQRFFVSLGLLLLAWLGLVSVLLFF